MHVLIRRPYAPLVRANSVFWNVSGVSVSGGLVRGVEVKLESLRSLAAGGINFATPDANARPAREGQVFPLHADRQEGMADVGAEDRSAATERRRPETGAQAGK